MNTFVCNSVKLAELAVEVLSVPLVRIQDGSGSSHLNGPEGWIRGLSMARIRPTYETYPLVCAALEELRGRIQLGGTVQVMVNRLESGGELSAHRDGYPDNDRYHLPVVTHDLAYWWDEQWGRRHMVKGWWYGPVPYCGILHSAGNPSPVDRIHIVVDFKKGKC